MEEYISKEEIDRVLSNRIDRNDECLNGARDKKLFEEEKYFFTLIFEDEQIKALIEELEPSADVRPNIHGHWIKDEENKYHCSKCGRTVKKDWTEDMQIDYPFCHCGADMRGDRND